MPGIVVDAESKQRTFLPFAIIGSVCIVAGGLVSAALAHSPTEHAMWAVAYLVLVGGVAQIALGAGWTWLTGRQAATSVSTAELIAWNLGNAGVIAGTITDTTLVTDAGGVLLAAGLVIALAATRGARAGWPLHGYRLLLLVVLISIPIGLILARVTGG